jgi:UDP-2,3-diacylglucosamine pyrophosphatase LpxH
MLRTLWNLIKSHNILRQDESQQQSDRFRSSGCEWVIESTTTKADIRVLKGTLRCLVLSDVHSPFFYPPAIALALSIGKYIKPHLVILNGDFVDCFSVSPFRWSSREDNLHNEIEISRQLLDIITKTFPDTPFIFIEGNHELFLQKYIRRRAAALSLLEEIKIPSLLGFKGKNRYYLRREEEYASFETSAFPSVYFYNAHGTPRLLVIHGDGLGISKGACHFARLVHQRVLMNTICGHWHVSQTWHSFTLEGERISAWVFPPLCFPRPHWRHSIWGLGVGFFQLDAAGSLNVDIVDFVTDPERKVLRAKYGEKVFEEGLSPADTKNYK